MAAAWWSAILATPSGYETGTNGVGKPPGQFVYKSQELAWQIVEAWWDQSLEDTHGLIQAPDRLHGRYLERFGEQHVTNVARTAQLVAWEGLEGGLPS